MGSNNTVKNQFLILYFNNEINWVLYIYLYKGSVQSQKIHTVV